MQGNIFQYLQIPTISIMTNAKDSLNNIVVQFMEFSFHKFAHYWFTRCSYGKIYD